MCRLRKTYYNARHEASAQIDEIVGETASEADSSETSVSEKENAHEKDDDVIRCVCGLHKDEGLMIQCDKCMVSPRRPACGQGRRRCAHLAVHWGPIPFRAPHFPSRSRLPRSGVDGAPDGGASALRCLVGEWSQEGQGRGAVPGLQPGEHGWGGTHPFWHPVPGRPPSAPLGKGRRGAVFRARRFPTRARADQAAHLVQAPPLPPVFNRF